MAWLLGVVAGLGLTLQVGMNSQLRKVLQSANLAALISFTVGTLALVALVVVMRTPMPARDTFAAVPYWAWFGGTLNAEQGFLEQQKKIAPGPKQLTFWLWWAAGNAPTSIFKVKIDGQEIFALTGANNSAYRSGWTAVAIDVSAYADNSTHTLRIEQSNTANSGYTNIFLDDINFGGLSGTPIPTATGTPTASPTATSTAGPSYKLLFPLVAR